MISKSFNTAGPCDPLRHYMLPPEARLGKVSELIDEASLCRQHQEATGQPFSEVALEASIPISRPAFVAADSRALPLLLALKEEPDT